MQSCDVSGEETVTDENSAAKLKDGEDVSRLYSSLMKRLIKEYFGDIEFI